MRQALYYITIIVAFLISSCSSSGDGRLSRALEFAGGNSSEFFAVLDYYKNDPDTMKRRAAIWLIENMPFHVSVINEGNDAVETAKKNYIEKGFIDQDSLNALIACHGRLKSVGDMQILKADFLIRNIELAFEAWKNRPWGKYYTFDEFCEYLLPYRATNEPLADWRTALASRYGYILDSVYTGSDVIEAANAVCRVLKDEGYIHTMTFNQLGPASPMFVADNRIGDCSDECNFTILVLRALGIPAQYDFYRFSPETFSSHGWCVVLDTTKLNVPLFYSDFFAERGRMETDPRRKCKVYRHTYELQESVFETLNDKSVPSILKDPHSMDVTAEYFDTKLSLPVNEVDKDYYLGVFNRERIVPIVKGVVKGDSVFFGAVEDKNIYLLISGEIGDLALESAPFIFREDGLQYLIPDTTNMVSELLYRKYPMPVWNKERLYRVVGAKFYAGDTFGEIGRELCEIADTPIVCYNRYPLRMSSEAGQRYVKYKVRNDVPVELAEMHFFNGDKEIKPVSVIAGEPYDKHNPAMRLANCFDGDPLTYFLSKEMGDTIIFDFGKPTPLTHVVCVPRNDDNFIRVGDEYELFYFDKSQGWILLMRQKATQVTIPCHVPAGALLLLSDRTRGKEEQIFYFNNHKQTYINDIQ